MVRHSRDPWLLFLYDTCPRSCLGTYLADRKALFLSRLSRREEAIEHALLSIAGYPWNWSAWTLLGSCIGDGEEVTFVIVAFFIAY
jgi:anaphase-promoting complex subunit 8